MQTQAPAPPSWRDNVSKEQRSGLFRLVFQILKTKEQFANRDEKDVQKIALTLTQEYWRNSTSFDDFKLKINSLNQSQGLSAMGMVPMQGLMQPGMGAAVPSVPPNMQQYKAAAAAMAKAKLTQQQAQTQQPAVRPNQESSAQQVLNDDLAKFWQVVDKVSKHKDIIETYLQSFEQKLQISEKKYKQFLEESRGKEIDAKTKQAFETEQQKYKSLKERFSIVKKMISVQPSERESEKIDTAKYNILLQIDNSIDNFLKDNRKSNPTQSTSIAPKKAPSTPPLEKQRTKDASKSFLDAISAMEREYPQQLHQNLRQLLSHINILYESSIFDVFSDAFDTKQELSESDNNTFGSILGKRKRLAYCPDDEVPSIQTTLAFTRVDPNGGLKRMKLTPQEEENNSQVKSEDVPSLQYLEDYLQNNITNDVTYIRSVTFNIERVTNDKFVIRCVLQSDSVQHIPELAVTVLVHPKASNDNLVEFVSVVFNSQKIDSANSVFTDAASQFEKEISTKYSGYARNEKVMRVSSIINQWICSFDRVLASTSESLFAL